MLTIFDETRTIRSVSTSSVDLCQRYLCLNSFHKQFLLNTHFLQKTSKPCDAKSRTPNDGKLNCIVGCWGCYCLRKQRFTGQGTIFKNFLLKVSRERFEQTFKVINKSGVRGRTNHYASVTPSRR